MKNYVFWRTPTLTRSRESKYSPRHALAELGKLTSVRKHDKALQWTGFSFLSLEAALRNSAVVVTPDGEELNPYDAWGIVKQALGTLMRDSGGGKPIDPEQLLRSADQEASQFLRSRLEKYVVVTSLSVRSLPRRKIKVGTHLISAIPKGARRTYPSPNSQALRLSRQQYQAHLKASRYLWIRITTQGRSAAEAVTDALRALTLTRALWSLDATFGGGGYSLFGVERTTPMGVIHGGPVHTLHWPDRSLVEGNVWHEHEYLEDRDLFEPREGWEKLERARRKWMGKLRMLPYRVEMEDILARYVDAMGQWDLNVAFLQLWSLLEKVTGTAAGGPRYDDTIKRCAWWFDDQQLTIELLNILRQRRNRYVHASRSDLGRGDAAFQIKRFVEPHLIALLFNEFGVQSVEEYGRMLSLPHSIDGLTARLDEFRRILRVARKLTAGTSS